jgi:hypothetical protein
MDYHHVLYSNGNLWVCGYHTYFQTTPDPYKMLVCSGFMQLFSFLSSLDRISAISHCCSLKALSTSCRACELGLMTCQHENEELETQHSNALKELQCLQLTRLASNNRPARKASVKSFSPSGSAGMICVCL